MNIQMLESFTTVNDRRFSWLGNIFLKNFQDLLNSAEPRQGIFTKDVRQKSFYHRKYVKD